MEFGLPNGRKSPSTPPPGSCPTPNGCLAVTMGLVRTPQGHQQSSWRTPVLKPSSNSGLPIAWITAPATDASLANHLKYVLFKLLNLSFHPYFLIKHYSDHLKFKEKSRKSKKNILLILLFFQHFGEILSRVILIFPSYLG